MSMATNTSASDRRVIAPAAHVSLTDDRPEHAVPHVGYVRRAESVLGLAISVFLLFKHRKTINWVTFVALFAYIDVVGYLPGLARVHQKRSPIIEKPFYWAYNATHTFLTAIPVAALTTWRSRPGRWSALAVFIHLFGDRGLLGNFTKKVGEEFEHIDN